jgi:hypothetical protein
LESKDFAISPEMAIKAHLLGFKLGEIPTSYCNRTAGKTKFVIPLMTLKYLALFKYRFYDRKDIARETFLRKEGAV